MKMTMKTEAAGRVVMVVFAAVLLGSAGCLSRSNYPEPTPAQVRSALDGLTMSVDDEDVPLASEDISMVKVVQVLAGTEDTQASAIIQFNYRYRGDNLKVDGVITYGRSKAEALIKPVFEANDVR